MKKSAANKRRDSRRLYIRRKSLVAGDDSEWFCDPEDGRPIWFGKATWAKFYLTSFAPEQEATVVRGRLANDISREEWLISVLPSGLDTTTYLRALEASVRENRRTQARAAQ